MKTLTILGSTGSIGTNTLDVVRQNRSEYVVYALAAGQRTDVLAAQIQEFHPQVAITATAEGLERLAGQLRESGLPRAEWPELGWGSAGLLDVATAPQVDVLMSSIVGVAGLEATYAAIRLGKRIGLANKEVLVSGGKLVMDAVRECGAELIPVDSEHNGAHQCLRAGNREEVCRLILTASGGPFRNTPSRSPRFCDPRASPQSSNLEDGESHHHRLRHAHEQGFRGD